MNNKHAFKSAWWLNNGHLQTIFPALFRRVAPITTRRERLFTADYDFIDIDYCGAEQRPIVILLHGLTGSAGSVYIRGLQTVLAAQGFRSATLNFRGCSGEPNNTACIYHSGDTRDIDFLYRTLRSRYPNLPMAAVGFSLGGNVLLKWLAEGAERIDLFAAVAVSTPFLLDQCATRLDQGLSKIYRRFLLEDLKQYIARKHRYLVDNGYRQEAEKLAGVGDISALTSFWEYDSQVVAKLYGFIDAAHYYRVSSSRQYLKAILVPTLLIQAADDPFMTAEVTPEPEDLSAAVTLEQTSGGGHVGFISGQNPFKPIYWLEKRIPAFLRSQLP